MPSRAAGAGHHRIVESSTCRMACAAGACASPGACLHGRVGIQKDREEILHRGGRSAMKWAHWDAQRTQESPLGAQSVGTHLPEPRRPGLLPRPSLLQGNPMPSAMGACGDNLSGAARPWVASGPDGPRQPWPQRVQALLQEADDRWQRGSEVWPEQARARGSAKLPCAPAMWARTEGECCPSR